MAKINVKEWLTFVSEKGIMNDKMTNGSVFQRYEKKFLLTKDQYEGMLITIARHMRLDPYCKNGEMYHLRNIYFDTLDHQLISMSLLKPDFKEKLRIRKYGKQGDGTNLVFLEVKRKIRGIVTKRRASLSLQEIDDFMNQGRIPTRENYFDKQILSELHYMTNIYSLQKAVFIEYNRLAFFDRHDEEFRVTFDHDIYTRYDNFDFESKVKGLPLLAKDMVLMEVKVGEAMPLWFAKTLARLDIYLNSFSKYGKAYEYSLAKEMGNDV
jgi:SPX domain protein involved in polyphosphate accumulation